VNTLKKIQKHSERTAKC